MAKTDCVSCHMPKRRTQDVVHVVMTDHRIQKPVAGANLLAPLEERDPSVAEIKVYDRERAPADAPLYLALAAMRLEKSSHLPPVTEVEPRLDIAAAQLRQKRYGDLETTARAIL